MKGATGVWNRSDDALLLSGEAGSGHTEGLSPCLILLQAHIFSMCGPAQDLQLVVSGSDSRNEAQRSSYISI